MFNFCYLIGKKEGDMFLGDCIDRVLNQDVRDVRIDQDHW